MERQPFQIRIADTGKTFPCGEEQFILAAMRRACLGPHGCHGGGCGVCKMKCVGGRVQIVKRMSRAHITAEEEAQGYVLTCCVQPRSDVVLAEIGTKPTAIKEPVGGDKGEIIKA